MIPEHSKPKTTGDPKKTENRPFPLRALRTAILDPLRKPCPNLDSEGGTHTETHSGGTASTHLRPRAPPRPRKGARRATSSSPSPSVRQGWGAGTATHRHARGWRYSARGFLHPRASLFQSAGPGRQKGAAQQRGRPVNALNRANTASICQKIQKASPQANKKKS
jgi:hypothetical protein